jgi:hypothetical protein
VPEVKALLLLAGIATVSWVAPTNNVDGTTIALPIQYRVYGARQGDPKSVVGTTTGNSLAVTVADGQTWCAHVTANTDTESAPSLEACKDMPPAQQARPSAPTNLTVE